MPPSRDAGRQARKGRSLRARRARSPREPSAVALANARAELSAAGFTEAALRERLGVGAGQSLRVYFNSVGDPLLAASEPPSPLELLIALFLQGAPVDRSAVERVLPASTIDTLCLLGVLTKQGPRRLRSTVALVPLGDLYVATDPHDSRDRPDHVFFPDGSTEAVLKLVGLIGDGPRGTAVDVGSGPGTVALTAAQMGFRRVIAVEPNPRAVEFARRNALLNEVPLEIRRGTLDYARRQFRDVDLFTFTLPRLFASSISSLAYKAREGSSLLDSTYAAIDEMLSPEGRAVVFHQARTAPRHDVERVLERHPGLQAVYCPSLWTPGLEFGGSLIRRRRPGEPGFVHVPDAGSNNLAGAAALAGRLETEAVLARGEREALRSVPYLPGHVSVVRWFFCVDGRLVRAPTVTMGDKVFPRQALGVLRRCDGRRTLAEVLRVDPEAETAAIPDLVRGLISAGQIYLRPS
jgi:SAM-dependent methyltransferase